MKSYGICFCLTLSLSLTASESMHVVANGTIVILCMVEQCTNVCVSVSTVCVHISHLRCHSSVDRHWDYFCILAIINNVVTNIGCRYLFELFLCSADLYPVLGLLDHLAVLFLVFLRSLHTIFHSGPKRETRNQSLRFNQSPWESLTLSTLWAVALLQARRLCLLWEAELVSIGGSSKFPFPLRYFEWSQSQGTVLSVPRGHLEGYLGGNWQMLVESSGCRSGTLLSILHHPGQPHNREVSSPKCQ